MSAYHWLVTQGLYRDLVSAGILVPIMHLVAGRPLRRVARALESGARDVARDVETPLQRITRAEYGPRP